LRETNLKQPIFPVISWSWFDLLTCNI